MADNGNGYRSPLLMGEGQHTIDRTGGGEDYSLALRQTRALLLRRALEVLYVGAYVPAIVGPWVLALYVPAVFGWAMPRLACWLSGDTERDRVSPWSLVSIGALALLALALLPEARAWWPCAWLWDRWGLRWLWLRGLLLLLPLVPWRAEEPYLTNRQRRSVTMPTSDGTAHAVAPAHTLTVPGTWNPYRDPAAPLAPAAVVRVLFRSADNAGSLRRLDCPEDIATEAQLLRFARAVIDEGEPPARNVMAAKLRIFSDAGWRKLQDWLVSHALLAKAGSARNAAYSLTDDGAAWLRTIHAGEHKEE